MGVVLAAYIQPRAAKTEYVGIHGDALKFRMTAPPVEGAANEELCRFLAKLFSISKTAVHIEMGETGRRKRVRLNGVSTDNVRRVLQPRNGS